jgi:hypothetical protein
MDTRAFFYVVLVAIAVAAGCDKQEKESQYSSAQQPVKGTDPQAAIVPAKPDTDVDHGNSAAQKGGSPHAGTGEPKASLRKTP